MSTPDNADRELAEGVEYVWRTVPCLPSTAALRKAQVILGGQEVLEARLYLNRTLTVEKSHMEEA